MAGPGIPPGAASVVGGRPSPSLVETSLHQPLGAGARPFPLTPQDAAQPAPQPAVEFLNTPLVCASRKYCIQPRSSGARVLTVRPTDCPRPTRKTSRSLLRSRP